MSSGCNEVEAAVNPLIRVDFPIHPRLSVQVLFILVLNEVNDRLPAVKETVNVYTKWNST